MATTRTGFPVPFEKSFTVFLNMRNDVSLGEEFEWISQDKPLYLSAPTPSPDLPLTYTGLSRPLIPPDPRSSIGLTVPIQRLTSQTRSICSADRLDFHLSKLPGSFLVCVCRRELHKLLSVLLSLLSCFLLPLLIRLVLCF